jgi:hypothetical protein
MAGLYYFEFLSPVGWGRATTGRYALFTLVGIAARTILCIRHQHASFRKQHKRAKDRGGGRKPPARSSAERCVRAIPNPQTDAIGDALICQIETARRSTSKNAAQLMRQNQLSFGRVKRWRLRLPHASPLTALAVC